MWCPPKLEQQIWCLLNDDEVHSNFRLCNDAGESIPNGSKSYNRVDSMNRTLTHWLKPSVPSSTPNPRTITQGGSQQTSANTSKRPIDFIRLASRINWCGLTSDRLSLRLEIPPLGLPWFREWYHFLPNPNTRTALLGESIVEKKRLWNSWHMSIISTYLILSAFYFVSSIKRLNKCIVQNKTLFNIIGLGLIQFASLAASDVCFLNGSWQIAFG